jgi:ribosome-binding protein aMBF1 (putative translation factor)
MSTKSRELKARFDQIMAFESKEDRLEHDSKILMFKFLSLIEQEMSKSEMSKKELAALLNTSPSYVTQIFRGQKTINLLTLAKLQQIFEIEFKIVSEKVAGKSRILEGKRKESIPGIKNKSGTNKKRVKDHAL